MIVLEKMLRADLAPIPQEQLLCDRRNKVKLGELNSYMCSRLLVSFVLQFTSEASCGVSVNVGSAPLVQELLYLVHTPENVIGRFPIFNTDVSLQY